MNLGHTTRKEFIDPMGQKVHPKSLRLKIIHNWECNWIASSKASYAKYVVEDNAIRQFIKTKYKSAMVSRVELDRKASRLIVRLITARTGVLIGRGGQNLDALRKQIQKMTDRKDIQIDVVEVAKPDIESQLIAESIAGQLERRVAYRRCMKQSMQRAMRAGAKGVKIMISGRLAGAEIARTEWAREGRIPLHTFRADIDYGFSEAKTVFGIIGVKVWIFRGEVLPGSEVVQNVKVKSGPDRAANHAPNAGGGRGDRGDRPRRGKPKQNG